ncbi:MAG: DEAD/DEAH box helicase [Bacteroidales bacterium]|nr:DEAD/DEAH box helicase [Bacteroidales bacterium]
MKGGFRNIDFDDLWRFATKQSYFKNLYDYQQKKKYEIYRAWQNGFRNIMLQMPTGTGKTRLFSSIIKDLQDYYYTQKEKEKNVNKRLSIFIPKVLVLVHRRELVKQISDTLFYTYNHICGKIISQTVEEQDCNVQVASVQSLSREERLNNWRNTKFDFIIIDEAHHSVAETYLRIRETFPYARTLGVTATPYRLNKQPFTDFYDKLIVSDPVYKFIKQGYLSDYEYYSIKPDSILQKEIYNLRIDIGDYAEAGMETLLNTNPIRANILETYEKYAKGKKGIIYAINQVHCWQLSNLFNQHGYRTTTIDSNTPKEDRDKIVDDFKQNKIDILCNVDIFTEGFDCPDIEFIQLCRPTMSLALYLQQVGRGLRRSHNKDKVLILDNVGLYNKFGLPSSMRKWQHHFEGKEDYLIDFPKEEFAGDLDLEDRKEHYVHFFDTEEGNEPTELIYKSKTLDNEPMCLSEIVKDFGYDISEVLAFFKENGYNLIPNSILNEEEYEFLKKHYLLDKDTVIGQIIHSILQHKKNEFLVNRDKSIDFIQQQSFNIPIDFAEKLLYEESSYEKYLTEEDDVNISDIIHYVKSKYNDYLKNTMNETVAKQKSFIWVNIMDLQKYLNCKILGIQFYEKYHSIVKDDKEEVVQWVMSKIFKIYSNTIYWGSDVAILTDEEKELYNDITINIGNNKYLALPKRYREQIELMQKKAYNFGLNKDINFFINTNKGKSDNIIKYKNMEYNIDMMSEKDLIELLLLIDAKKHLNLVNREQANARISFLEKTDYKKQLNTKIKSLGISKEELLKFLQEEQDETQKLNDLKNKKW